MKFLASHVGFAMLMCVNSPIFAAPPFYPQPVETLAPKQAPAKGYTRFKVSVSNGDLKDEKQVQIGNISICSDAACYRPSISKASIDLYDTSAGTSELIAEMAIPIAAVRSIHFERPAGLRAISGEIKLTTPLQLEGYQGGEVLLVLSKSIEKQEVNFYPEAAATGLLREAGTSVYYNPKIPTVTALPFGVTLEIPAGVVTSPRIFNVAVHDTGDVFPLVDIFPVVRLNQPASITYTQIMRAAGRAPIETLENSKPRKAVSETGVIRAPSKDSSSSLSQGGVVAAAATDSCVDSLSSSVNKQVINQALLSTGNVYLDWCINSPPYVHIVVSNPYFSPVAQFGLVHGSLQGMVNNNAPAISLQKITNYLSSNSQVVINGFHWEGDYGINPGGIGFANGFVSEGGVILGVNRVGGGGISSGNVAGNKLAMIFQANDYPYWEFGTTGPLFINVPNGTGPKVVISSSTSILTYQNCSTDSLTSAWSAFGTTPGPRMIFMSSTSGSATNAAELCPVFKALGAAAAIRMDGGPSTGMIVDGSHKNPLTGLDAFKYGNARHIAYGVRFSSIAGPTPTPIISRVNPPKDPCKVNPAACS